MERSRPSTTVRRDDPGEFRVGRLKHERVKVPRGEAMMEWAESVMQLHADRKSVLEVSRRGAGSASASLAVCPKRTVSVFRWSFRGRREPASVPRWNFTL